MEMLFKDAVVKKVDNQKTIQFLEPDIEEDYKFKKSFNNVVSLIDGYDIGKCTINQEKDIFYLYSFFIDCDNIESTLRSAIEGYKKDLLNIDETNVLNAIKGKNKAKIFWDVINDVIIVDGLNNLKTLLLQLERKRWECIKIQNEEFMQEYMDLCASKVYKKVMKKS